MTAEYEVRRRHIGNDVRVVLSPGFDEERLSDEERDMHEKLIKANWCSAGEIVIDRIFESEFDPYEVITIQEAVDRQIDFIMELMKNLTEALDHVE